MLNPLNTLTLLAAGAILLAGCAGKSEYALPTNNLDYPEAYIVDVNAEAALEKCKAMNPDGPPRVVSGGAEEMNICDIYSGAASLYPTPAGAYALAQTYLKGGMEVAVPHFQADMQAGKAVLTDPQYWIVSNVGTPMMDEGSIRKVVLMEVVNNDKAGYVPMRLLVPQKVGAKKEYEAPAPVDRGEPQSISYGI
jgi:hypothetical protein